MKHPDVGKRDANGRRFLGWRVRYACTQHRTHASKTFLRRDEKSDLGFTLEELAKTWNGRVVRVYRPESKTRRVLRELVANVRECDPCLGKDCKTCAALDNAKKHLEGT